jgi:hypothetical protein
MYAPRSLRRLRDETQRCRKSQNPEEAHTPLYGRDDGKI